MARLLIAMLALMSASVANADCFDRAASRFRINADLLRAIADVESRNRAEAIGPLLADGNRALGAMQVNSIHLGELARYGVTRQDLMSACGSIFTGTWIFAGYIHRFGPTWKAVGIYNTGPASSNRSAQARYIAAVRRRLAAIQHQVISRRRLTQGPAPHAAMMVWESE